MIVKLAAGAIKIRFDNTAYQNKPTRITKCDQWHVVSIKKEIAMTFNGFYFMKWMNLVWQDWIVKAFYVKTQTTEVHK